MMASTVKNGIVCSRISGGDGVAQHDGHTNRLTETCSHGLLRNSLILDMLWSTDTCQNKVPADQYHVTISRAQVYVLFKLTADQVLAFDWIVGCLTYWKEAWVVRKMVNANPGLKVLTCRLKPNYMVYIWWLLKPNNIQKTSPQS